MTDEPNTAEVTAQDCEAVKPIIAAAGGLCWNDPGAVEAMAIAHAAGRLASRPDDRPTSVGSFDEWTEDELRQSVRASVDQYGHNVFARSHGVSSGKLSEFLSGKRGAEPSIIEPCGYRWALVNANDYPRREDQEIAAAPDNTADRPTSMAIAFQCHGKQILANGIHYADAADEKAAQFMLDALLAAAPAMPVGGDRACACCGK